jgi:hypothetical protein
MEREPFGVESPKGERHHRLVIAAVLGIVKPIQAECCSQQHDQERDG